MEEHEIYEFGQMVYTTGSTFLDIILRDLGCGYSVGNIDSAGKLSISIPPRDSRVHMIAMHVPGHALAIAIDTRDMTFTILDPSGQADTLYDTIIAYMNGYGYTYKSHGCPIGRLPQQQDRLCALWTLYLIYETCKGVDPTDVIYKVDSEGLREFIQYAQDLFQESGLEASYRRLLSIIVEYIFNNDHLDVGRIHRLYREANKKEVFLDTIDKEFPIRDKCTRNIYTYYTMIGMITMAAKQYAIPQNVWQSLSSACTLGDIVDTILDSFPISTARGIIFMSLLILVPSGMFLLNDRGLEEALSSYPPDIRDIISEYVIRYISTIISVAREHGISIQENNYSYMNTIYSKIRRSERIWLYV